MHINRESIIDAAISLLDTYGLGDVTMRRVASSLGVAPGALY
ncbi:MAG: helix-turn-helix domain-containing protein, partial [Corynebacterium sp.]|nr:helix-turn-helix domain-containing protein [Corynebacterium sp.]